MTIDPIARIDGTVGRAIELAVEGHHRRRLRRLGHAAVLEAKAGGTWATGDPPPRPGNQLDILIDGAEALPAIAEALMQARSHVSITGWHLASHFELIRGERPVVLGALLAELARRVDVRVLVWAGAPVPAFHPTRKEVAAEVERLVRSTQIRCQVDPREHPFHCHHEKTVIVDDEVAFVGGIDMTDFAGDRFDLSEHPARRRMGWHDVGTRLQGPAVTDVAAHFAMRWREVTGEGLHVGDPPPPAGPSTVQVVRTIAETMYESVPRGEFRILEGYLRALHSARECIYLENQFLWAPEIVDVLADKLRHPPAEEFRLVIVLPRRANNGQDDTRGQLGRLISADDGNGRLLAATLRSRTAGRTDPLYVHAKVGIVDDRWLTVGSANLNAHSLMNDTEMNVITDDPEVARATRERLWAEHLELDRDQVHGIEPRALVDEHWIPMAHEQLRRERDGGEPTHHLIALPGVSQRSGRLLGPLAGLVDDG
ncbi:MAG TPA: phosphatidylserine/phosphatidylglycerophosphate/cardiolipin synthase family protein [Solirubrobacteraceae bacterium]|jgi:phosphatidylserine/phosphatidylglycerophosphate/cardiolipin synthase-like enzyme|nr:phosphatidylserine/phosphatidylglycerophosphate/cardiolipin synthase family protein [Solirubrobacteraceae bacterium]